MAIVAREIRSREEWLEWRRRDLTASDLGAVAGVDPRRTALAVYAEKTGLKTADAETNLMMRGRIMEYAIQAAIEERHPDWKVKRPRVYVHDEELRLGATPDLIAELPDQPELLCNIQMKTVSRPVFERDWGDGVPLYVQLQSLCEAMLLGAPINKVAVLVLETYGVELVIRDVPRHAQAEARVRDIARSFWEHIARGVRPKADYGRDADALALAYPADQDAAAIDLAGDNRLAELLPEREALRLAEKTARDRIDAIDDEIKEKLGSAQHGFLPGWKLLWKEYEVEAYAVAAHKKRPLRVYPVKPVAER